MKYDHSFFRNEKEIIHSVFFMSKNPFPRELYFVLSVVAAVATAAVAVVVVKK